MNLQFINVPSTVSRAFMINPNYFFLKAYYKHKSQHFDKINWLKYLHDRIFNVDWYIDHLQKEQVDILCMSLFIWNVDISLEIARRYKEINPKVKILIGGPNVYSLYLEERWPEFYFIDYGIYGDGEEAFAEVIDSIIEDRSLKEDAVNIITHDKKYEHRVFNDFAFKKKSPYLMLADEIREYINFIKEKYNLKANEIDLKYERSRGCPYKCSFCDWSSGLHNKVKRKENDWKEEIDFILSLDVMFSPVDANWGIYEEDLEITDYVVDKSFFSVQNVAKIDKDRVFKLYNILARSNNGSRGLKFSFQDIHDEVLENIDRPDEKWHIQKDFIKQFQKDWPEITIFPEIMIGLPGQTIENFSHMLEEFSKLKFPEIQHYLWEMISASPGAKQEYRDRFKIETQYMIDLEYIGGSRFHSLKELEQNVKNQNKEFVRTEKVIGTYSADLADIMTMYSACQYYDLILQHTGSFKKQRAVLPIIIYNIRDYFKSQQSWMKENGILAVEHPKKPGLYIPHREYASVMPWEELFLNP